ncbi:MAG: ATP-binding cassette domain-containing protein [Burkholderiales bacterium]
MSGATLSLDDVRIALAGRDLVGPLSLTVAPGECVTVMGPSGAGKSTLLAFVAGTLAPAFSATGRVQLGARDVTHAPPQARRTGILFQDDLLFPHLTVGGNLAFALPAAIRDRDERRARIAAALAEADLAGYEARDPATLSGGQRARVALMRTLLAQPEALLLDEPFGKLDAALRDGMRRFVLDHAHERGLPVLLVTHDPSDAQAAGGRVLSLAALR